ncbi:hypothetical protein ACFV0O_40790 [Kitasatospora sp. NPDC059577]|uniref:hypothetical protein n=1 Tax=Kitasatospora sp. NPDC059577 TaxID=3346873 RepID=UPI0036B1D457
MYWYLTVRSDRRHGGSVPVCALVRHLEAVPGLRRTDPASYQTEAGPDWLTVTVAACDEAGNYAVHAGRVAQRVNVTPPPDESGGFSLTLAGVAADQPGP